MFALKSTYLNSAYLGPMPVSARDAVVKMADRMLDPAFFLHPQWRAIPDDLRGQLARLIGGDSERVSINSAVSELVSFVADGLDLEERDEVLLLEGDYPSMVLPWMVRAERNGFKVRFVPLKDFLQPASLRSHITSRTRLVSNSHVMFNTGIRLPSERIAAMCKSLDLLYLTDVSQSLGGMTLPEQLVDDADIITGVCYKWLLSPYGSAFGYFSRRALEKLRRCHASWLQNPKSQNSENLLQYSTVSLPGARKFDRGQPASFLVTAGWRAALDVILEKNLSRIEAQNAKLVSDFLSALPRKFEVVAPKDLRSNIICIQSPDLNAKELRDRLEKANIDVSVREGALRISFHFFNTEKDVEQLLRFL